MDKTVPGSSNPTAQNGVPSLEDLIQLRLSRRAFTGSLALGGMLLAGGCVRMPGTGPAPPSRPPGFRFEEISRGTDHWHHLPPGYSGPVLLRWGDPLFDGAPSFEPMNQSVAAQQLQFGYNNDFVGFIPLADPQKRQRGLLCVNHEYTTGEMMFPDWKKQLDQWNTAVLRQYFGIEMAAHGGSVVEIVLDEDTWRVQLDSGYNRRITATTPMRLTGPAAGHRRLRTAADATGTRVAGTLNNCAGGITPWGTWLMAEENFHLYFHGTSLPDNAGAERENHERYGVLGDAWGRKKPWGKLPDFHRFNLSQTPNEANRFGWIVEVDPLDPTSMPQKRTALGRFKHEGAETVLAPDGRLVVYMGDDEQYEYVYKFISRDRVDRKNRHRNRDLLDAGTLYVARFAEDGSLQWLPLQFGEGGLTPANGFHSQADVLIETRRAADLLGATPMDRPEDVEPEQQSGSVWVMLTNNVVRKESEVHPANPRAKNTFGHIIEIIEPRTAISVHCHRTGTSWCSAATRANRKSVRRGTPQPLPMAGSVPRTIAPSTRPVACGSPPMATKKPRRRMVRRRRMVCGRLPVLRAVRRSGAHFSARRSVPRFAGRALRRTAEPCSWPCSTRGREALLRSLTRAGRISRMACRPAPRCWPFAGMMGGPWASRPQSCPCAAAVLPVRCCSPARVPPHPPALFFVPEGIPPGLRCVPELRTAWSPPGSPGRRCRPSRRRRCRERCVWSAPAWLRRPHHRLPAPACETAGSIRA